MTRLSPLHALWKSMRVAAQMISRTLAPQTGPSMTRCPVPVQAQQSGLRNQLRLAGYQQGAGRR